MENTSSLLSEREINGLPDRVVRLRERGLLLVTNPQKYLADFRRFYGDNVLVLLSGGVDSTVLASLFKSEGNIHVTAIQFDLIGRPSGEKEAADQIAAIVANETIIVTPTHSPESYFYFIKQAAQIAVNRKIRPVVMGPILEDWVQNPNDLTQPWLFQKLRKWIRKNYADRIVIPNLLTPFLYLEKRQVVRLGSQIGSPLELTWSCTDSSDSTPCNECLQCRQRDEALRELNYE